MIKNLLLLTVSVLLWTGCDPRSSPTETPAIEAYTPYEVKFIDFTQSDSDCTGDSTDRCTTVEIHFPEVADSTRTTVADKINSEIRNRILRNDMYDSITYKRPEEMASSFIDDFEELHREFPEAFGWLLNIDGEILRNDSLYISMNIQKETYTGGAHANRLVQFMTFDAKTGEILTLDDIFKPGYEKELNKITEAKFREVKGLTADEDPGAHGFTFENNRFYNPDNFAMLTEGILFYFNGYEIAPYAMGPTEILIPHSEIIPLQAEF